jgi:hypothetical protein
MGVERDIMRSPSKASPSLLMISNSLRLLNKLKLFLFVLFRKLLATPD